MNLLKVEDLLHENLNGYMLELFQTIQKQEELLHPEKSKKVNLSLLPMLQYIAAYPEKMTYLFKSLIPLMNDELEEEGNNIINIIQKFETLTQKLNILRTGILLEKYNIRNIPENLDRIFIYKGELVLVKGIEFGQPLSDEIAFRPHICFLFSDIIILHEKGKPEEYFYFPSDQISISSIPDYIKKESIITNAFQIVVSRNENEIQHFIFMCETSTVECVWLWYLYRTIQKNFSDIDEFLYDTGENDSYSGYITCWSPNFKTKSVFCVLCNNTILIYLDKTKKVIISIIRCKDYEISHKEDKFLLNQNQKISYMFYCERKWKDIFLHLEEKQTINE